MAVVRIVAPARWHRKAAKALLKIGEKRGARELKRAAERHGLAAELHGDEPRLLATALPKDERAQEALRAYEEALVRDQERIERLRLIQKRWPRETDRSLEE